MALPPGLKKAAEEFHAHRRRPRSIDQILGDAPEQPEQKESGRVFDPDLGRYRRPKHGE